MKNFKESHERLTSKEEGQRGIEAPSLSPEQRFAALLREEEGRMEEHNAGIRAIITELPADDPVAKEGARSLERLRKRAGALMRRVVLAGSLAAQAAPAHAETMSTGSDSLERANVQQNIHDAERPFVDGKNIQLEYGPLRNPEEREAFIQQTLHDLENLSVDGKKAALQYLEKLPAEQKEIPVDILERFVEVDKARAWLARNAHSDEYMRKAIENEHLTPAQVMERRRRSLQDKVVLDYPVFDAAFGPRADGVYVANAQEVPKSFRDRIFINPSVPRDELFTILVHEGQHFVTRLDRGMSETAKNLYHEGLNPEASVMPGDKEYVTSPHELDARKKQFESEFEKLSDWKYGEPFTDEREKQARQLLNDGKFSPSAADFLYLIKPEYLQKIMDTIAETEPSGEREKRKLV